MSHDTDRIAGTLLGLAVGDAIGLPREGLSRRRATRVFGGAPLRHRFVLGRGMFSDDTEHACMTAQALLASRGDTERFARSLAWRLRAWLLCLPAGTGMATARAIAKLWLGFSARSSGVYSAGNGPAMRAPVLAIVAGDSVERLTALNRISTRITHTDPRAEEGALAVALATAYGLRCGADGVRAPDGFLGLVAPQLRGEELLARLQSARDMLRRGASVAEYADALGQQNGVSGYIAHTVPVALYAWLRHPDDFRAAVEAAILLGGDTDTTGAVTGALAGASLGAAAIPPEWLSACCDWPRSARWIRALAERLGGAPAPETSHERDVRGTAGVPPAPLPLCWPALPLRNLVFLALVLGHGFRRLLPPY